MVVHKDPHISWTEVEENWRALANIESATWVATFFNKKEGVRYCLWLAADEKELRSIFDEFNVSWDSILEVEETTRIFGVGNGKNILRKKKRPTPWRFDWTNPFKFNIKIR